MENHVSLLSELIANRSLQYLLFFVASSEHTKLS